MMCVGGYDAKQGPVGLLGTETFLSSFAWEDSASLTFSEFQQVEQLLIKGEAAKTTWGKIKGTERFIKIRRKGM